MFMSAMVRIFSFQRWNVLFNEAKPSYKVELSIQFHVTIINQSNDLNVMRYYIKLNNMPCVLYLLLKHENVPATKKLCYVRISFLPCSFINKVNLEPSSASNVCFLCLGQILMY